MQNDAANIYCPNPNCETPNPETNNFCQQCRTPLPRRYLWAVYEGKLPYKSGEILAERYLLKGNRILLDTKPALPPVTAEEVPNPIAAYLRLFPYRLHVPQVYGQLSRSQTRLPADIWLLEQAPLAVAATPKAPVEVELRPQLTNVWKKASAMRQLHWLWQIAQLWQPFSTEGVASSLLNPELLRAEGQLVRLLQLQGDRQAPTLSQLGQMWSQWVSGANPLVAPFLERLCQQMVQGRVRSGEQLVGVLDRALEVCGRSQKRTYQIATGTDTGPSRRRNEDSCYPPGGTFASPATEPIAIVCDGIGGHEGGNVASASAIEAIRQRILTLQSHPENLDTQTLIQNLEAAACAANDVISDRNNDEQRQGRQRMGTTVVMALGHAHELYITHVGDSRAYWISPTGCYQVTLDDDVASREVRLGYAIYRDAVQQPAAGSLVQALGMNASGMLHPTVGRFILDEDSVFLLCSDGLSDNDRVEQSWETEILPILTGQIDLPSAVSRLIAVGNTLNGHDNVTVGLVYCQVRENKQSDVKPESLLAELEAVLSTWANSDETPAEDLPTEPSVSSTANTVIVERSPKANPLPWLFTIALLLLMLGGGGMLAYLFVPQLKATIDPLIANKRNGEPETPSTATSSPPTSPSPVEVPFPIGSFIQILSSVPQALRETASEIDPVKGTVSDRSVLKVLDRKLTPDNHTWLLLKVCEQGKPPATPPKPTPTARNPVAITPQPPTSSPSSPALLQLGDTGWILEPKVVALSPSQHTPTPEQLNNCADPSPPSPTPSNPTTPAPTASP